MTQQIPSLGRIVHVRVDPRRNGNMDVATGIITKVHEDGVHVNLRILYDTGQDDRRSYIPMKDSPEEATGTFEAFWPPRV